MLVTEAFARADRALEGVVRQIRDDQWDMVMPAEFRTRAARDTPITLREVINYHAYDDAWIPDMLAGRTMAEVGEQSFKGDLLGDDPQRSFSEIVDRAVAAAEQLTDLDTVLHFTYGEFPAHDGLWHVISFRGLRAVDLARVIGVDDTLDPELAQAMYDAFLPQVDLWRQMGVFGPEVPVADDAPIQQRLLGLTGRPPTAG